MKEISAQDVLQIYNDLHKHHVKIWLDGGWGIDALLEEQTRPHEDVDIVVEQKNLSALEKYLRGRGYGDVPRDDTRAWNFVLGDKNSNEIDIHVVILDEDGNGIYGPSENGDVYPAQALTGSGKINDQSVLCLSAEYQVESHTGYELRKKDFLDMEKLSAKFNLDLPAAYKK